MTGEKLKATHAGAIKIGDFEISCAVLEDGSRVLVERSMAQALGKKGSGAHWKKKREGNPDGVLPEYASAKYLAPFMDEDLTEKLKHPVQYINVRGTEAIGIDAAALPDICNLWIMARDNGALDEQQIQTANRAYILMRGFANIGITALIDEATGYQYDREKDALNKILEAYIQKEFLPWTKRFPDEFYKQIFRLKGWEYNPKSVKRPSFIGKLTNKLIYDQLPSGVLEELKNKTPKSPKGNYLKRLHQGLTEDIGQPHLDKHLASIITLMRISPNWRTFESHFNRAFGGQLSFNDELQI